MSKVRVAHKRLRIPVMRGYSVACAKSRHRNGDLKAHQFAGVSVRDFRAVRFTDGGAVEPLPRFDDVLIGVVDRIQDAVRTDLEKDIGEGLGAEIAAGRDVEILAQVGAERTLRIEDEAATPNAIVDAPDAERNRLA